MLISIMCHRWLGEKYDGIRCCWNPLRRRVYPFLFLFTSHLFFYLSTIKAFLFRPSFLSLISLISSCIFI